MRTLVRRIASLLGRRHGDADLAEEVRLHLDLLAADYERQGMTADEARYAARRAFGGVEPMKDRYRDRRGLTWLEDLSRDLRYGLRTMRRHPGLSIVAAVTLALGIGANTALFSVINAVMLTPLPVPRPDDLRIFSVTGGPASVPGFAFSYAVYEDLKRDATGFTGIALHGRLNRMRLLVGSGAGATEASRDFEPIQGQAVSGNFFDVLGVRAAAGRLLSPDDDRPDAATVVLSDRFWQRRFGRASDVIGRSIVINDQPFTIVGVAPAGFAGVEVGANPDLWWPVRAFPRVQRANPGVFTFRGVRSWGLIGRLAPGADPSRAEAQARVVFEVDKQDQLTRTATRLGGTVPPAQRAAIEGLQMQLQPGRAGSTSLRWQFRRPLLVLLGLVVLVLLIACANVANLLLARATARRQELAVRMALGSGRGRIIRQMLTESALVAVAGAMLGIGIAVGGARLITSFLSTGEISIAAPLDRRVFAFTTGLSLLTAFVAGLVPAVAAARLNLARRDARAAASRGRLAVHHGIVGAQVALSIVVLVTAGLFLRTLANLQRVDTGIDRARLTQISLDLPSSHTPERRLAVHRDVLRRVADVSGQPAAISMFGMLSGTGWSDRIEVDGRPPDPNAMAYGVVVSSGFFEVTGTRIVAGRVFSAEHDRAPDNVAVINQTMARQYFGGTAVGQRFRLPDPFPADTFTVIGVAADSTYSSVRNEAAAALPVVYFPALAGPATRQTQNMGNVRLTVRTTGAGVEGAIRAAIRDSDPSIMIAEIRTMDAVVQDTMARETLLAQLGAWFGAVALVLGAIGIYGVRAYSVSRRVAEFGLRLALGATPGQVLRRVISQGAVLAATGIMAGLVAAAIATRLVRTLLFDVTPLDAPTFAVAAATFGGVAIVASYLPARRAMRIDPATALRAE